jgi:hypothetical protein
MLPVEIGTRKRQIATSWNELTRRQLLQVAQSHGRQFPSVVAQRRDLLRILLQVPGYLFGRLNAVQHVQLNQYTRFLREPTEYAPLTAQLLPTLRCWLRTYHGPRENFRNLLFSEFIFADAFFLRYLQTNDEAQLDQLVAVLYRPQRADYNPTSPAYGGDRREDFNEHLLPRRARRLRHLPHHVKYAVLLWYRGCRHALTTRFEYVFSGENNAKAAASGWADVLHQLADGVHHIDATERQPLKTVLREMDRLLRQHEESQATH